MDKGSAVVIPDREQYLEEGSRQLNDKTYYMKFTKTSIYLQTIPMVEKIINNLPKEIHQHQTKELFTQVFWTKGKTLLHASKDP